MRSAFRIFRKMECVLRRSLKTDFAEKLSGAGTEKTSICCTAVSVSYTHLDVYKRQIADKENGEVILLEGSHYLHFEQKKAIVERTTQWIDNR